MGSHLKRETTQSFFSPPPPFAVRRRSVWFEKRRSRELALALPKQRERAVSIKVTTLTGIISIKGGELIPLNLMHRKQHGEERLAAGSGHKPY